MIADDDAALGRQQARQQKLRITRYVEELLPKQVLDLGTLIMVMQVDSPLNGSALQTVISVVFPLPAAEGNELIRGIKESGEGGTFKTKIYRPLIDVTRDDVLDAFPIQFPGGRRTMERICYRARDCIVSHIEQEMGEADLERKGQLAKFVVKSLEKYIERDCVAPDFGKPFPPDRAQEESLNDEITNKVTEYVLPTKLEKRPKRVGSKSRSPYAPKIDDLSESEGSDPFADLDQTGGTSNTANETMDTVETIEFNRTKRYQETAATNAGRLRTHEIFSTRANASHAAEEFAVPTRNTRSEAGANNMGNVDVGNILKDLDIARSFG